jgi:hypothetical protein
LGTLETDAKGMETVLRLAKRFRKKILIASREFLLTPTQDISKERWCRIDVRT